MKILKMIMYSVCVLSALSLSLYGLNYYSNEQMITKVQDNVFVNNPFSWLGFMEPWVEYYNEGISLQHQKKYDEAIEKYDQALDTAIPWKDAAPIRINKVLSIIAPIIPEEITLDTVDGVIETLEDCQLILGQDGCAKDNGEGYDPDSQQLYDDIQDWIDELKKKKQEMQEEQQKEEQKNKDQEESEDQENQDQSEDGDQNKDQQNQDNDESGDGKEKEDQDGDKEDGEEEKQPEEGDEEEQEASGAETGEDGEPMNPEQEKEQELKDAFNDLQNQAFVDRIANSDEDAEPGSVIYVEEYW